MPQQETTLQESDWGVPLPGELVPPEQQAHTHLKRLPLGQFKVAAVFGLDAPLVVDLGCGNGRSVIVQALAHPEKVYLGIDIFNGSIRHAVRRANRRGLHNVRFAVADAMDVVSRLLGDATVTEMHLYHPQPVYDLAQAHKRLLTPRFLLHVHRVLKSQGCFILQTDHPAYWTYLKQILPLYFQVQEYDTPWPDAPAGRTRREILARQMGLPIFRAECKPWPNLDRQQALEQADQLPLPLFDADRRLQALDEREKCENGL